MPLHFSLQYQHLQYQHFVISIFHIPFPMSFGQRSLRGQGRGSWRGGANRGGGGGAWYPKPLPTAPSGPKGPTIDSIDIKALLIEEDAPEIDNVEYIASYNWLDSAKPTVLVPGKHPPRPSRTCDRLPTHQMSNTDSASQAHHLLGLRLQRICS